MPKLYFYDTGLACALLGLQEPGQLKLHHMKGNLFENFVISELIKQYYNKGRSHHLFFWRDNTGHEIDVVIERPGSLFPVEIKSGKTITKNYFKGLEFWQKLTEEQEGAVVYAGDDMQRRSSGITVYSWNQIPEIGT